MILVNEMLQRMDERQYEFEDMSCKILGKNKIMIA